MSIALIIPDRKLEDLQQRLQQALPDTCIEIWPDISEPAEVDFVVAWKPPAGVWANFQELKAIQCFGAGVDSLLSDPLLPQVALSRIVDPALSAAMVRYLDGVVSYYKLRLDLFGQQQNMRLWKPRSGRRLQQICVLGLGELGIAAARHFLQLGYQITGWSRTLKTLSDIRCFSGETGLMAAVADADIVICLLPLTAETENLLNHERFAYFKAGSILINVARGAIVDDDALLQALDSGKPEAACLDVFRQEPLPSGHPFWEHQAVMITPHISAVTNVETVVAQIAENYRRSQAELPLLYPVNPEKGY